MPPEGGAPKEAAAGMIGGANACALTGSSDASTRDLGGGGGGGGGGYYGGGGGGASAFSGIAAGGGGGSGLCPAICLQNLASQRAGDGEITIAYR